MSAWTYELVVLKQRWNGDGLIPSGPDYFDWVVWHAMTTIGSGSVHLELCSVLEPGRPLEILNALCVDEHVVLGRQAILSGAFGPVLRWLEDPEWNEAWASEFRILASMIRIAEDSLEAHEEFRLVVMTECLGIVQY